MTLREQKQAIRAFLQTPVWTEEKLCALLVHAQDKLSLWSCCCLIGVATADHALQGRLGLRAPYGGHFLVSRHLPLALKAEEAFDQLAHPWDTFGADGDELRRRRIRPIIRAELRRRSHATSPSTPERLALDVESKEAELTRS